MKEAIPFDMHATGTLDPQAAAPTNVAGGRYSLRRMLGRGGMGIVWLAFDEPLQREVALKFLPSHIRFDAAALAELRRETARSQKLTHPNIVRIHDLHEAENEDAFISMEYVDGPDLGALRLQQSERVLSWSYLEPLLPQLCEALEYAHAEGIVHRDLKPANVMVEQSGRLKLADFGIARAVTETVSRTSSPKTSGTLLYMSPQQLEGAPPAVTDDIYGLGAMLYELLSGKPPFHTGDLPHQVRNVLAKPLRAQLREMKLTNHIPAHVEELVMACLNKSDAQRPQRAREVAQWAATRQRPRGQPQRSGLGLRIMAALSSAVRARPAWCFGGAAAVAAIATVCAIAGHSHGKVEARETKGSDHSPAERVAAEKSVTKPAQQVAAAASSKTLEDAAGNPVRTASPPFVPKPADRTTNVLIGGATPPTTFAVVRPDSQPVSSPTQISAVPAANPLRPKASPLAGVAAAPARTVARPPAAARPAPKPLTALQLARKGNTHVSERSKNQVLQISSAQAPIDSPPEDWRVAYYDPKAQSKSVDVLFEGGQMTRVYEPARLLGFLTPAPQEPIDLEKLKIDSDEALRIALGLPVVAGFAVRSVRFDLERGYGGLPVWKVRLYGRSSANQPSAEQVLGYAIILADDGRVLKETFSKKIPHSKNE